MANASNAMERKRIAQMKTAADFNREEEEKKAKAKAEAEQAPQIPVMTRDGSKYYCGNPGCATKTFVLEENGPEACRYHSG